MTLSLVPVGSTLVRRYYVAADLYDVSDRHDEPGHAALDALHAWSTADADGEIQPPMIDERWVLRTPDGTTYDVLVDRDRVSTGLTSGTFTSRADRAAVADLAAAAIRRVLGEHAEADALP